MSDLRELFLLRPGIAYLNHGSFGACPRAVFEAYQQRQLELERDPVEFLGRRFAGLMAEARGALGALLDAPAADLVYVPNTTTALNAVARSLDLKPGDEVLGTNHEYGAMERMWRRVCQAAGARFVRRLVPVPVEEPGELVETLWSGVTEHTRVLFFSHISSPTAITFPAQELVRRARESGIISVVDGAHAPGQIPLSLRRVDPDFYAGNCHKWLMAPKGAAFLYARPDCQAMLQPPVWSWGAERAGPGTPAFLAEFEYQGTRDIAAYLAVPEAIAFLTAWRWDEVRERCHGLLSETRRRLSALTGLTPPAPEGRGWYRQMSTLPLPACETRTVQQRLFREFAVEVPVFEWEGRQYIRLSIQGYNDERDVDTLIGALGALFGRRT
jgi:isopenicillin-N epimerase